MKILAGMALLALVPATTVAADFDYTFAEAGYSKVDTDLKIGTLGFTGGQGYQLDGAYALNEHWYLEGDYRYNNLRQYVSATKFTQDFTLTPQSLRLGGGYHTSLGDSMDVLAHLDYGTSSTDLSQTHPYVSTTEHDHGYVVGVGLRIPTELMEFDLGLDHDNLGLGRVISICAGGKCGVFVAGVRQDGTENVLSAALHHDFGPVTASVEYRRGSYQGWRRLLVSLRVNW